MPNIETELAPDPRERQDWFQRLPPEVQASTRAVWQRRRAQMTIVRSAVVRDLGRNAREGALLMVIVTVFADLFTLRAWSALLLIVGVAASTGAIVGVLIASRGGGRFRAAILGTVGYVAAQVSATSLWSEHLHMITFFLGGWMAANVFGVYGLRLESRRSVFESIG